MDFKEYFELDISGLVSDVLKTAHADKVVTKDEKALIKRITADLKAYEKALNKYAKKKRISETEVLRLQNKLRMVLINAIKTADLDQVISKDEQQIILVVADVVEEAIRKQMDLLEQI